MYYKFLNFIWKNKSPIALPNNDPRQYKALLYGVIVNCCLIAKDKSDFTHLSNYCEDCYNFS